MTRMIDNALRGLAGAVLAAVTISASAIGQEAIAPTADSLTIVSGDETHAFTVEIAATPEDRETGLMNRTELAEDAGMLFDYGGLQRASMWMKDTPLPLDILFAGADGTILAIARNTVPQSERPIQPGVSVRGVLELDANTAKRLGIEPGDRIEHPIFTKADGE